MNEEILITSNIAINRHYFVNVVFKTPADTLVMILITSHRLLNEKEDFIQQEIKDILSQ